MIFYASIAEGVCPIWLRFEPDRDQSPVTPVPGSGHVGLFKIARRIALKVMDSFQ